MNDFVILPKVIVFQKNFPSKPSKINFGVQAPGWSPKFILEIVLLVYSFGLSRLSSYY